MNIRKFRIQFQKEYFMCTTEPIRDKKEMRKLVRFFEENGQTRNLVMVIVGFATALRISDVLNLKWGEVYDFEINDFLTHIDLTEQKTGKQKLIKISNYVKKALKKLLREVINREGCVSADDYIFSNGRREGNHISRVQAWRIIKKAVKALEIRGNIACHSLRKTFGYYAWKYLKKSEAVIMEIYRHSSWAATKHYLGITQDDLDELYDEMVL